MITNPELLHEPEPLSPGRSDVERHKLKTSRLLVTVVAGVCCVALAFGFGLSGWGFSGRGVSVRSGLFSSGSRENIDSLDARLLMAATNALGERGGTVIIMDPRTGRIRALVNPKIAFEEAFRPGSTIKPFTALAALRSGMLDEESQSVCREKYSHQGFHTTCSHPRNLPPLNPTEAIAYSCNYYFGKVGERLEEPDFASTLSEFGFGRKSGVNQNGESAGKLLRSAFSPENAMGEGDYLETTPIQLINAYTAFVNGGHLFTPRVAKANGFVSQVRSEIEINAEDRGLILKGMRGAIRYGTAESAGLYSLPLYMLGKTGTATEPDAFRMHGWFVGFASAPNVNENVGAGADRKMDSPGLVVLVFLTKGHGADDAEVARPILAAYAREISNANQTEEPANEREAADSSVASIIQQSGSPANSVRVYLSAENATLTLSLEDYVRGVVAAEGSTERELEALKALAIASRTYALRNMHRHAKDGYDFCTTTHCQRFRDTSAPEATASSDVAVAVETTKGEVLVGGDNQTADAYFSASCGGATANLTTLWGANAPPYLRGVRDDYCQNEPHANWTDRISQAQLLKALQSDPRTDVGHRLNGVRILRTDATGRAELISLDGDRRMTIKGWDLKIIVGRALGWQLLKSSRFTVERSGADFVFRGRGFGHGLGLCQEGAHVMAARGASYQQILAKYFPTTRIKRNGTAPSESSNYNPAQTARSFANLLWRAEPGDPPRSSFQRARAPRLTLASEGLRLSYPASMNRREAEKVISLIEAGRRSLVERIRAVGLKPQFPALEIFINETTGDFVGRTGQPPWAAAATRNSRIELQPIAILQRRQILETTLRHELVHTIVDAMGHGRTPRWLAEGLALHYADEGRLIARYEPRTRMTIDTIEKQLGEAKSAAEMKTAYAAAYREVKKLINLEGEAQVWRRVAR